ncbi:hypothetical protein B0T22DRAFT_459088 [Podospora appendiculata]|uniref:Uncharacterized protein n=1 Tax=Podospora appendiculata TaxID=314037 RepID=A0AAE1CCA3_9PEZI|nr:hypothetical protein B0T22DRAFT_459088 [Podospora appendiculata]
MARPTVLPLASTENQHQAEVTDNGYILIFSSPSETGHDVYEDNQNTSSMSMNNANLDAINDGVDAMGDNARSGLALAGPSRQNRNRAASNYLKRRAPADDDDDGDDDGGDLSKRPEKKQKKITTRKTSQAFGAPARESNGGTSLAPQQQGTKRPRESNDGELADDGYEHGEGQHMNKKSKISVNQGQHVNTAPAKSLEVRKLATWGLNNENVVALPRSSRAARATNYYEAEPDEEAQDKTNDQVHGKLQKQNEAVAAARAPTKAKANKKNYNMGGSYDEKKHHVLPCQQCITKRVEDVLAKNHGNKTLGEILRYENCGIRKGYERCTRCYKAGRRDVVKCIPVPTHALAAVRNFINACRKLPPIIAKNATEPHAGYLAKLQKDEKEAAKLAATVMQALSLPHPGNQPDHTDDQAIAGPSNSHRFPASSGPRALATTAATRAVPAQHGTFDLVSAKGADKGKGIDKSKGKGKGKGVDKSNGVNKDKGVDKSQAGITVPGTNQPPTVGGGATLGPVVIGRSPGRSGPGLLNRLRAHDALQEELKAYLPQTYFEKLMLRTIEDLKEQNAELEATVNGLTWDLTLLQGADPDDPDSVNFVAPGTGGHIVRRNPNDPRLLNWKPSGTIGQMADTFIGLKS